MKPNLTSVLSELATRTDKPFKLEEYLFDKQLTFVNDPSHFKVAVTSRRSGKTVSCAADLMYTAMVNIETVGLYITLSRTNAKRLIWPELKRINRKFKLGVDFNESELSATFPNGSIIYCSGASDKSEIEKFRGLALIKVYIDECQSFPNYIQDLIDEVLAPALMDYAGTLCLIGTPGPIPAGYFYDSSLSKTWSHHKWTFFDNPFIASKSKSTHQEVLSRELNRRGVDATNPSIQREWYGKWVLDSDSLVYQYKAGVNHYEKLPEAKYTYLMGVDLGFNDADAICILAWSDASRLTYLVEEVVTRKQGITELVDQIEQLRSKYDVAKVVMDTGGLGKKVAEEIIRRYKIPVQAAEKVRKVEYIELMNDDLRTGRFKARADSLFAQDCMKVEWDVDKTTPDKKIISSRFHSDICEAVLYAWRESFSFTHSVPAPAPIQGSDAWLDELEEQAFEWAKRQQKIDDFDPY